MSEFMLGPFYTPSREEISELRQWEFNQSVKSLLELILQFEYIMGDYSGVHISSYSWPSIRERIKTLQNQLRNQGV